jgi:hypothetical protein
MGVETKRSPIRWVKIRWWRLRRQKIRCELELSPQVMRRVAGCRGRFTNNAIQRAWGYIVSNVGLGHLTPLGTKLCRRTRRAAAVSGTISSMRTDRLDRGALLRSNHRLHRFVSFKFRWSEFGCNRGTSTFRRVRKRSISISRTHIHISVAVRLEATVSAVIAKNRDECDYRESERWTTPRSFAGPIALNIPGLKGPGCQGQSSEDSEGEKGIVVCAQSNSRSVGNKVDRVGVVLVILRSTKRAVDLPGTNKESMYGSGNQNGIIDLHIERLSTRAADQGGY